MLVAVTAVAGLLVTSAVANVIIESVERATFTPYGERVQISTGDINVYRSGSGDMTIVLLAGLGTTAPALDFAPLIAELDDHFTVVVVEGFGYGYSDLAASERTVENITAELHETLSTLGIDEPYILAGHSIAGYYTLYYANEYPGELAAVIGIDATVPTDAVAEADGTEPGGGINWGGILRAMGVVRWATTIVPALSDPGSEVFTTAQREQIRAMANWTYSNDAVFDETNRLTQNGHTVYPLRYPKELPVLNFLATGKSTWTPDLHQLNQDRLQAVPHQQIVLLDGDHYLHYTHSAEMAATILEFLGSV